MTDLGVEATVVVTATGSMGFSGPVNLALSAVGSDGTTPLTDWAPTFGSASGANVITLAENGTGSASFTLSLAGDVSELLGSIKVAATSTAAESDAAVAVTANPVLSVTFTDAGTGTCDYKGVAKKAFKLKLGRSIDVYDGSTAAKGLITHVDGGINGFAHQNVNAPVAVGAAYKSTPTATGGPVNFYCHGASGTMQDGDNKDLEPTLQVIN